VYEQLLSVRSHPTSTPTGVADEAVCTHRPEAQLQRLDQLLLKHKLDPASAVAHKLPDTRQLDLLRGKQCVSRRNKCWHMAGTPPVTALQVARTRSRAP
jgi:hypothetical protein